MTSDEEYQGRHEDEVPQPCGVIPAKERGNTAELDGPIDGDAGHDTAEREEWDNCVGEFLKCVVLLLRWMFFSNTEIIKNHRENTGHIGLLEQCRASAMLAENIIEDVNNPVDSKQPHGKEMPHPCPRQPAAERDGIGKCKTEERGRIVDPQAARDHDQERQSVQPMGDADERRMLVLFPSWSFHSA